MSCVVVLIYPRAKRWFTRQLVRRFWIWPTIGLWILLCMDWRAVFTDGVAFDRFGGMVALMGLLLMTAAQERADRGIGPPKISMDTFYKRGFVFAAIGTMIWALGDLYLEMIHRTPLRIWAPVVSVLVLLYAMIFRPNQSTDPMP